MIRRLLTALTFTCLCLASSLSMAQINLLEKNKVIEYAKNGDYDGLRVQLLKGGNADSADSNGRSALFEAAAKQDLSIMELLLEFDAHVDWSDDLGNTALYYAVNASLYDSVQFLIEHEANANNTNKQGVTPLMVAARVGDPDIFMMLMDAGGDPNFKDYSGNGIMDYARQSRNTNIVNVARRAGIPD